MTPHKLPHPAAETQGPVLTPCAFDDPTCPCQDGDACHHVDVGDTKAWAPPTEERKREWAAITGAQP